jgi:hypothetical protein
MSAKLGGTSLLYLVASSPEAEGLKEPARLAYLEALQRQVETDRDVGKTVSVVDLVKRVNRVVHEDRPEQEALPATRDVVGQCLFLVGMAAKPATLENLLEAESRRANLWVQLKSWDASAVERVVGRVEAYTRDHPSPGLTV